MQAGSESFSGPAASLLTGLDMSHIRLCPAIAFNQIVGGRYKLHILCVLNSGPHRYGEIGRSLLKGGLGKPITPRILSRELKELEQRGLIDRKAYPVVPRKVEYSLTNRGRALLPILAEIIRWGATGAHEEILEGA
ncbi:helix-turn-helix domain-containing protein [Chelativorans sp. M5D2P16]|uniref:winged helix-turn-helix transcriptional regulator n=1 Tax=Chelativorans sp. M5D2P16 TaxID=3095678 RepID=UPI002ACA7AE9|nr:helix-turn-helix domain-containing protein [Chelativorans sp. M5D2P16]MDZ5698401.1 helix-turn-helix domain-containing protein [Chelativorans sp. M5D2P16]